ncbi:hypothetical protein D3C73_1664700 [compost metagenome]
MIDDQPAPCQMPERIYIGRKYSGSDINEIGVPPKAVTSKLTGPVGDIKTKSIPTTTTTEMKFGAYRNN